MATVPGALLLCISSPYAHRGALYDAHRRHYAQDGDPVLVWQADTRSMNPSVDETIIADAHADDPAAARSEYGAEFRSDLEGFVSLEVLRACVIADRAALPPAHGRCAGCRAVMHHRAAGQRDAAVFPPRRAACAATRLRSLARQVGIISLLPAARWRTRNP